MKSKWFNFARNEVIGFDFGKKNVPSFLISHCTIHCIPPDDMNPIMIQNIRWRIKMVHIIQLTT